MKPLEGLFVVDFSQFLSGPSASLRLADLGARVIKIERPGSGDLCRALYISNLELDGDSTLFHSINRNKESFAADLKNADDRARVLKLVAQADVMIQNFRPGVIEKLGLDYESVRRWNDRLVYGEITGYGGKGPWRDKPGQDLLLQSLSGLAWLNGNADQPPMPFGLSVVDMFAGAHLVQGILACLVRRGITGKGGKVEVSLLESILDVQFEVLTTHLNDGGQLPQRSTINNAHAYLGAPYGIYATADGYLALAMGSIIRLGELLGCPPLLAYTDPKSLFTLRDEIKAILVAHLKTRGTKHWLSILEPADIWCSDVYNWRQLMEQEAFQSLDMIQEVKRSEEIHLRTTRCPIRIDGEILKNPKGAPRLGQDTLRLTEDFALAAPEAQAAGESTSERKRP
ncbi:MAG TPA: CaiB/BaiF CoA-transferase family protein [Acidobacteriaceae bacterium]|nr:CaiB/BaiF CoA-transferase family protein [Acidobacteriaceae bacterium]